MTSHPPISSSSARPAVPSNWPLGRSLILSLFVLLLLPVAAKAANVTWSNAPTTNTWNTAGDWAGGVAPVTNDALFFDASSTYSLSNNFAANTRFNGLTFNSGAGAYVLAGNSITLGGNIVNSSTNLQTIAFDITSASSLGRNYTMTAGGGNILISGRITSGAINTAGTGTLILTGNNSANAFNMALNTGTTLRISASNNLTTGTFNINNATLDMRNDVGFNIGKNITLNTASPTYVFNVDRAVGGTGTNQTMTIGNLTLSQALGNGGIMNMTVTGSNGYGLTTGTLTATNYLNTQTWNIANNAPGLLTMAGFASDHTSNVNDSSLVFSGTGNITIGAVTDTGSGVGKITLIKNGANTLTLTSSNTYGKRTTLNQGTVALSNSAAFGTGDVAVASNSTILALGNLTVTNNYTLASGATATFDSGANLWTNSGVISSNGALTKAGAGTLILSQTNTYTGTTTINSGTLQLGNGGSTGSLATTSAITNNGTFAINRSNAVSQGTDFSGAAITGTGSFTQAGTGTTTLTAANTYTGGTTVNGGTLQLSGSGSLGATNSSVIVSSGTLDLGTLTRTNSTFTISGGSITNGTLTASTYALNGGTIFSTLGNGAVTVGGNATLGSANRLNSNSTLNIASGQLTLGGAETISSFTNTGGTLAGTGLTLTAGTYQLNGGTVSANLGGGTLFVGGTATLSGNAGASAVNVTNGTLSLNGQLTNSSAALTISNNATVTLGTNQNIGSLTLTNGTLGGTGTLTASTYALNGGTITANLGTGTVNVGGNTTLNGTAAATTINVNSGTLTSGSADRLSSSATVAVSNGATLNLGGFNQTLAGLTGSGNVTNSNGTLTLSNTSGNNTFDGSIAGAGALTKSGAGAVTLAGNNTFTGGISLNSGTLNFMSSSSLGTGSLGMNAGSTLAYKGIGPASLGNAISVSGVGTSIIDGNATNATLTGAISLANSSTLQLTNGQFSVSTNITGQGGLNLSGSGSSATLSASNNYSGGTLLSSGQLNINNNSALGTGALTITSGTTLNNTSGGNVSITNAINLNSFTFLGGGNLSQNTGAITLQGNSTINVAANTLLLGGNISGGYGLTKTGAGTLNLTGNNNYSGPTAISGGSMNLGSVSALGSSSISLSGGGIMNFTNLSSGSTFANNIGVATGTGIVQNSSGQELTLSGNLSKNGSTLQLSGGQFAVTGGITGSSANSDLWLSNATVTLSGNNTYNGPTALFGGSTLNLGVANALPTNTMLYLGTTTLGGSADTSSTLNTLNLNGYSQTVSGLKSSASIGNNIVTNSSLTYATLTLDGATNSSFAGSLNGNLGLTVSGTNSLTLSGTNAYTGITTVKDGTLKLASAAFLSGSSQVNIETGGTLLLSGNNQVNTSAALNLKGGTLSMGGQGTGGQRASSQTFQGLTLTANSTIDFSALSGESALYFSNISGLDTWKLSIFNWSGKNQWGTTSSGDATRLYDATGSSLTTAQLKNISFYGTSGQFMGSAAVFTSGGLTEIVPVPEPSVIIAAMLLLGWMLFANRGVLSGHLSTLINRRRRA